MPPTPVFPEIARRRCRYSIEGDKPPWRPVNAYDDGREVYVEFSPGIVQGEKPPFFVFGANGIAVFNEPAGSIGRPVETGERIMQVSPAASSRIEIELPAVDAMAFEDGAEVMFFNNVEPDRPAYGHVVFISYATSLSPTGILAYTVRADLDHGHELRLGLKGTAKIFGPLRPLILQLLRRPIGFVRELLA